VSNVLFGKILIGREDGGGGLEKGGEKEKESSRNKTLERVRRKGKEQVVLSFALFLTNKRNEKKYTDVFFFYAKN